MADPDQIRSIYFLGFDVDERLAERLAELKRSGAIPARALPLPLELGAPFSADNFTKALGSGAKPPAYDVVPGGRQLRGAMPLRLDEAVRSLAAALVPLPDKYPLPFFRVKP